MVSPTHPLAGLTVNNLAQASMGLAFLPEPMQPSAHACRFAVPVQVEIADGHRQG